MEWDVFSFSSTVLLSLGLALTVEAERQGITPSKLVIQGGFAISILLVPVFIVNGSQPMLSKRLEVIGVRVFKTYYERGRETIEIAQSIAEASPKEMLGRKQKVVDELKDYAVLGEDPSYATLVTDLGIYQYSNSVALTEALSTLEDGLTYFPSHRDNHLYQTQILFELGQYQRAYVKSLKLVEFKYPTEVQSIRIAIQMALESNLFREAESLCDRYLLLNPTDKFIFNVRERLAKQDRVDKLKFLFLRSSG